MDDATLAALRTAASALWDIGLATMVGALATVILLGDARSDWAAQRVRRCRRLFMGAGVAALAASVAWAEVQAIALTELPPGAALLASGDVMATTPFGHGWAVATLALLAGVALAGRARRLGPGLGLALALAAAGHAGTGHAAANGFGWRVALDALHVLATGLWAGSVIAGAWMVSRGRPDADDGPRHARRLSALATAALAVVVATGLAAAWHGLGHSLRPLAPAGASSWGHVLDAKLGLVALAVALGAVNRLAVLPSLPGAWPRFARVLQAEAVVLLAALAVAAVLANGEPPAV